MTRASAEPSRTAGGAELPRAAERLARLSAGLLAALPLIMWAANRSAPLVLTLAAVAALASSLAAGEREALLRRLRVMIASPVGMAICGFLAWALISIGWSHRPQASLAVWGELSLPIACGTVIAASRRPLATPWLAKALAVTVIATVVLILVEMTSGMSQRIALGIGKYQEAFIFNRPVLICLLLSIPVVDRLARTGRSVDRFVGVVVAAAVSILVLRSESGAAVLGLGVAGLVWIVALLLPRISAALVAVAFAATMILAPMIGGIANALIPPRMHETLHDSHTRDRVDYWLGFGEAIRARPLIGAGFGTSATLDRHPVAEQVSPARRDALKASHPHNAPVQLWTETGIVGAAFALAAGLLTLLPLLRRRAAEVAPRLAAFASAFAVASVAHGAWQGWWIALLAVTAILLARPDRTADHA